MWLLLTTVLIACAPMIAASQFAAHLRFDVVDDQMFGYFGWRIYEGGTVYKDVWDNKPPGIYWTNALGFWLGMGSYGGVIALCALSLIASHVLFFTIAASVYFRGAAAVTTVLASFFITHGYFTGGTNRTESFLILFELAAVTLYVRGSFRDRWWLWFVSGLFCGAAFLYKQVGLAAWGAMGLHTIALVMLRELPVLAGMRRCLLLLAGVSVAPILAVAALSLQGALGEAWFATFTFNRAYFLHGDSSMTDTYLNRHMLFNHMADILKLPMLMCVAGLIHASLWWLRPRLRPVEIERPLQEFRPAVPHSLLLFVAWMVIAFYGATVSPHRFRHYLVPVLPPMLLMAGYLINVIKTEIGLFDRLQQRAWVVASFLGMGYLCLAAYHEHIGTVGRVWVDRFERGKLADWEKIANSVVSITSPEDRIHCWGYFPGVYLHAKRLNASRFITTEKIGQVGKYADFQQVELERALFDHPPAVFVVSNEDWTWMSSDEPLDIYRERLGRKIVPWLQEKYRRVQEVSIGDGNVFIYKRNDLLEAPNGAASKPTSSTTGAP